MRSDLRLVLTSCGSRDLAEQIAATLVERRLAACVNVLPGIHSTYRWQGAIERDEEVLLMIKTAATEIDAIESAIRSLSNYELPELIAVEIAGGGADYLAWVADSLGGNSSD